MGGATLAAVMAVAVIVGVGVGGKKSLPEVNAANNLTLALSSSNGLPSSDTKSSETYVWNTTTSNGYHTSWSAKGVSYVSGHFLHIALNGGEFHNTITLHQITSVKATGTESGSTTASLSLYASSTGNDSDWGTAQVIASGAEATTFTASQNIGFLKFEYNREGGTVENYVDTVTITYNCVA